MSDEPRTNGFEVLIVAILCAMMVLSPLALGGVAPWARGVLFLMSVVLFAVWLMAVARWGELRVARSSVWFFIAALFGLAFVQLIPLSPAALRAVSPGASATYAQALPAAAGLGGRGLSLAPYATRAEITRLATLAILFFVVVNTVRRRWQVVSLILALVAIGSFEALYGFAEQFSGRQHIFSLPRQYHLQAVTGTFHNKNHFAGLLEMIVPVCLGLLFAVARRSGRRWRGSGGASPRVRLAAALASARIYQQIVLAALAVVLLVAIFFSLSRAGIVCAVASLVGFAVFLGVAAGFRRYTVAMFLIVATVLSVAAGMGMELVISGLEDVPSSQSTSWMDRLDLARSALGCIRDYPLVGTGLGRWAWWAV